LFSFFSICCCATRQARFLRFVQIVTIKNQKKFNDKKPVRIVKRNEQILEYKLTSSVADQDPGWVKSGYGSGIRIRDEQPGSYFMELRNHFIG
jgi:hypothetical protein